MMVWQVEVLIGLCAVIVWLLYYYLTKNFDYWEKQNVSGPKPVPFFGSFKDVAFNKIHLADFSKLVYDAYANEPVVGLFHRSKPVLMLKDPEILKDVLIKHFTTFPNRDGKIHEDIDPLSQHLVHLNYERWRPLRKKLSPTFTSGKLKDMFYLINECTEHYVEYLKKLEAKNEPIECRELTSKFTTDVIGVCAFGLNMNAIADEDNEFRKYGRLWFDNSWFNRIRRGIRSLPTWAVKPLRPFARNDEVINFFVNTVKYTIDYRKKNNIRRNDFIDLLMELKDNPDQIGEEEMTDIMLTAQAFVFFLAGFETSSSTMSHAMYELACNPDMQDKLRQEINMTLDKNNGKLTYDAIKDMTYLDKVFKETLRKYPVAFTLSRVAVNDHTFTNSKISIDKGTAVSIPVYAIHHDSSIYPDPDKFDPERFDDKVASTRPPMSYLPFGDGPRNCIGERFAQNQTKLGLIAAVKNFQLDVCEKTFKVYKKQLNSILLAPVGGVYLKMKKLDVS